MSCKCISIFSLPKIAAADEEMNYITVKIHSLNLITPINA